MAKRKTSIIKEYGDQNYKTWLDFEKSIPSKPAEIAEIRARSDCKDAYPCDEIKEQLCECGVANARFPQIKNKTASCLRAKRLTKEKKETKKKGSK